MRVPPPVVHTSAPFFTIFVVHLLGASRGEEGPGAGATKLLSLVPVIAAVDSVSRGFILMLLGTVLAALNMVLTSIVQTPSAAPRLSTPSPVATPVGGG
ncbi:hypothetical protein FS837_006281, partial [Tulasnella sp. UAMH 9824]